MDARPFHVTSKDHSFPMRFWFNLLISSSSSADGGVCAAGSPARGSPDLPGGRGGLFGSYRSGGPGAPGPPFPVIGGRDLYFWGKACIFYPKGGAVVRILIVEDEDRMARTIQSLLKKQNYLSDIAADGEEGLDCILSGIYDLVILDVMLPRLDGFQVLERTRAQGVTIPVLLLTARSTVTDRIDGLDKGADYYLPKPFASGELLACIRALLRRPRELDSGTLDFGDISLDEEGGILSCGAASVSLNSRELELLRILMRSGGTPVSRESLLIKVWGIDTSPESNVVEAYMSFLRKKLSFIRSRVGIDSVRRIGYCLTRPEDDG